MSILDVKVLRDLRRLWAQALAIALVVAAGVATMVLGVGTWRSLEETRARFYERSRFADVFATVTRAPDGLADRIAGISGVAAVETRIVKHALLDIPEFPQPATGLFVSLPDDRMPALNQLHVRSGRLPEPDRSGEAVISESFAQAHGFREGARFSAILNGAKREILVVGIAISPEFIYAIGPGDLMPDDRRFGVVWLPEKVLAAAFDLKGAFSSVALKLRPGASEAETIAQLDALLEKYGGSGAHGRRDQSSHAFVDQELEQLRAMSAILPPIFLLVSAFLVNATLGRLVALEREQIGLLKAIGYGRLTIATHYLKFVVVIAAAGIAIGMAAGTWLGVGMARLYTEFFHFPFLVFLRTPDVYLLASTISIAASIIGALRAAGNAASLPPAVAMQPPTPTIYRRLLPAAINLNKIFSQPTIMVLRHLVRYPMRAAFAATGIALAVAVLVASLFADDSVEQMIDVTFFQADRQDATLTFYEKRPIGILSEAVRLPGVLAVEPRRTVPVRLRFGHVERRVQISGHRPDSDLGRILDLDFRPVALLPDGLALSDMLADLLGAQIGDRVQIELLEGGRRTVELPVTAVLQGYLGLGSFMDMESLHRLMREAPAATGVDFALDDRLPGNLYAALKKLPSVNGVALQRVSLAKFRETLARNMLVMTSVYSVLACIIGFGVVYNSARISISEHARELASLRVLGFTRAEVSRILVFEITILTLAAQPVGWAAGYGIAWLTIRSLENELFRVPLLVERSTYVTASLIVAAAATVSTLLVRRRIDRLDLIAVLKTRD